MVQTPADVTAPESDGSADHGPSDDLEDDVEQVLDSADVEQVLDKGPVRVAALGYLCGMLSVTVWPGGFTWLLGLFFTEDTAERLFALATLILVVPVALLAGGRTRRFGLYMVAGMVISVVVILAIAAIWTTFFVTGFND